MAHPVKIPLLLKRTANIAIFILFYFILPVYMAKARHDPSFKLLFLFYIFNAVIIFYLLKRHISVKYQIDYQQEQLQEKLNLINDENSRELKNYAALEAQILRYSSLKKIVEEINQSLDLDASAEQLIASTFSLISNNQGVCLLYLIDEQAQRLSLFKTKKEDKRLVIKAKEGDIFDHWVLRHAAPLIVEDIKKDFRFDLERLKTQDLRPVSSIISSPFISENRFLGILRLDSHYPNLYSQDDLRFLVMICDLGAVALENSQLYQKTQELAIHDELTALFTKGYLLHRLKEECEKNIRRNNVFSLLMLDIDLFKNYNDKFGHTAGDIVLKKISHVMEESLKPYSAFISRFGGEEFCAILMGLDKEKAYSVALQLRERIEKEKIILRRQDTFVTVSIGISVFPSDAQIPDDLINKADKAMYEAKQKGRNRVCCL